MEKLADALYSRFLLRDFFGKIIPGAIFLLPVTILLFKSSSILESLNDTSLGVWLLLLGFAWITAFAIQSFGERVGFIQYYPPSDGQSANQVQRDWYVKYAKLKNRNDYERHAQEFERLSVIMEACGNMYVALVVALPFYFILFLYFIYLAWYEFLVIVILYVLVTVFLRRMYLKHVERQAELVDVVLAMDDLDQR